MSDSFLQISIDYSRGFHGCGGGGSPGRHERELRLNDRESGVVGGVRFIVSAVIGDPAHDFVRIVAARKSSLGVGPISFGLAAMADRNLTRPLLRVAQMAWGFR